MVERKCKAVEYGLCVGKGIIKNNKQNLYCSKKCKDRVFFVQMQKNRPKKLTSPSGCTMTPTRSGRCEKAYECEYYVDCLSIAWRFETGGYKSDCKGFKQKNDTQSDGWQEYGDYTEPHILH